MSCLISSHLSSVRKFAALTLAAGFSCLSMPNLAMAQQPDANHGAWTGNFVRDPGFEEDFVNNHAEPHVISFKGDWFYNQRDLTPDYWNLKGEWTWNEQAPHSGHKSLKLAAGATASQDYKGAVYQEGGSAWSPAQALPMAIDRPERFREPWRATVWCRGGGTIRLGGVEAKAPTGDAWSQVTVECPVDKVDKDGSMQVTLTGPGEFDDLTVQEQMPDTPNLLPNGGFEQVDGKGYPYGWSYQKKFDWIGPTYYVFTDWMHFHEPNRGPVTTDKLIYNTGKRSLRFDVYPGDEKFVESDPIELNQDQPHIVEVSALVRADRIKLIDIRCVNQDGANLPCYYPVQPEYSSGGTALFGNGTFGWRYIRKFFAMPFNAPVKSIRVRLAARGFNGNTLDDSGTRSYACQAGTIWWDNVRVTERTSSEAELRARKVSLPGENAAEPNGEVQATSINLGERLYGDNELKLAVRNLGDSGNFRLELTTTLPGAKPVVSNSHRLYLATGDRGVLTVPYHIGKLAGDLKQQGTFRLRLRRDKSLVTDTTYAFNTWPVIVDFDVSRHYNLPAENPVTTSFNIGVASSTLAKVKRLVIRVKRFKDGAILAQKVVTDLPGEFALTRRALPDAPAKSYEFNLPTPAWWTDRTNLLLEKLDLSRLKVWPQDYPTRDSVVQVYAYDAAGKLLFADSSDGFCRVQAPPRQEAIKTVQVREDGAVLINGKPRFLTGATHQNTRTTHTPEIIAQLGLMGHRMPSGKFADTEKMWKDYGLYALQQKPVDNGDTTAAYTSMTPEQKAAFEKFVQEGGMQSVVSINTGGWETHIPDTPEARAGHVALNDWIRQLTQRPIAWSSSGGYNAWNMSDFPYYDIVHAETEMWGPMDFNTIFLPYMRKLRNSPTTWVYLPQLYDNTPYERYRFETYENIIRGSAGVEMIQGIGDPTFNRGLAGELRYLEAPLYSQDKAPEVKIEPNISHKVTRYNGKIYILATNCGPIALGRWKWNTAIKHSGKASHEGDSVNRLWQRPGGVRLHGFRGMPNPELIQSGDKIVQYVWIDPHDRPDWVGVAVRGDGRFSHVGVLGDFDYEKFRENYGNIFMYSELEQSVWHEINYVMDPDTYQLAIKVMGQKWADDIKKTADAERAVVDKKAYQAEHFYNVGAVPEGGQWVRMELDADMLGLTGKLVDGFAYMTHNGRALWDYSALERDGKIVRVFCEDTVGIDRSLLNNVRFSIPGLSPKAHVRALFEQRTLPVKQGSFTDNFQGVNTYGYEAGGVVGNMFGTVKDDNRVLPRLMPSGYGYSYGPTAVHIYEIQP
jgi:hypothetical protein